jgi:hypothetical protein
LDDLIDDMGSLPDVFIVENGVLKSGVTLDKGTVGDLDDFLEKGETWTLKFTTNVNLNPGEKLTNTATVTAFDDDNHRVTDSDVATIEDLVPAGNGQTPGFWKNNPTIANEELKEYGDSLQPPQTLNVNTSKYEAVFGVTLAGPADFNPTLLQALEAGGSGATGKDGQGALLRHSTAAFIAAASDAVDEDASGPGTQDELNFSFAGLAPSNTSGGFAILTILDKIDTSDDLKLSPTEVITAVQDVYNVGGGGFFGALGQPGKQDLADAFAAMNEQTHLAPGAF